MVSVSGEAVFDRIEQTRQLVGELEPILQSLMLNDSALIDGLAQMLGTLQHMQHRTEEHIANLAADLRELSAQLQAPASASPALPDGFDRDDPEISLLGHLLAFLPNNVALDVGANAGHVARALVEFGYEVFAFEPHGASYAKLQGEAAACDGRLHAFACAVGATDGTAELMLAADTSGAEKWDTSLFHSTVLHPMLEDLGFAGAETVAMATLGRLVREGAIPADAAVLKIDTEGADLDVVAGAGEARFAVVLMEFWDREHPFGRAGHGDLAALVQAMRGRGYGWHIVLYRVDERGELGFFQNLRSSVPKSWGNILFFRDFALFGEAARWCLRMFAARG